MIFGVIILCVPHINIQEVTQVHKMQTNISPHVLMTEFTPFFARFFLEHLYTLYISTRNICYTTSSDTSINFTDLFYHHPPYLEKLLP